MAVVNVLPNGYLVLTVSPREAVMLMDEILDPADFPWQHSESEVVAMEIKAQLRNAVENQVERSNEMVVGMIPPPNPQNQHD